MKSNHANNLAALWPHILQAKTVLLHGTVIQTGKPKIMHQTLGFKAGFLNP